MRRPPLTPEKAYEAIQRSAQPLRQAEALAFTRAARDLEAAMAPPIEPHRLEAALKLNQRLWAMVLDEISEPGNNLPAELRANLKRLAGLVDQRTIQALSSHDPRLLAVLVQIDLDVAAGLLDGMRKGRP